MVAISCVSGWNSLPLRAYLHIVQFLMDAETEGIAQELAQLTGVNSGIDRSSLTEEACTLCQRIFSCDNNHEMTNHAVSMCGDCKFLLLEDYSNINGSLSQDSSYRRSSRLRGRRIRYSSSESIDSLFSQQFSHILNLARQNQPILSDHEDHRPTDGDASFRVPHPSSSGSTPSGSSRWQHAFSDTESEDFGVLDSLYGESRSNFSFGSISFSAYGDESDASVDEHGFLDTEIFLQPENGNDIDTDTDTDIDPMQAGANPWNSGEEEEEGEEDADEGEEEEDELNSVEGNGSITWVGQNHSPDTVGSYRWRMRGTYIPNIFSNFGESIDARRFDELLEHLAETDTSRRGAPPAAVSCVRSLPCFVITREEQEGVICAICKELLSIGTQVNQLPCSHLYHPSCILPWLSARNSCPLCRFELPTDNKEYEEGKQLASNRIMEDTLQQHQRLQEMNEDDEVGADIFNGDSLGSGRDGASRRWFFLAAAPIISLVGIVLVLWLGNSSCSLMEGRGPIDRCNEHEQDQHSIGSSSSHPPNQRENRSGRWWSLF